MRLLAALPRDPENPLVIVGRKSGSHLTDLQHPWRRIRARTGLDDVRTICAIRSLLVHWRSARVCR